MEVRPLREPSPPCGKSQPVEFIDELVEGVPLGEEPKTVVIDPQGSFSIPRDHHHREVRIRVPEHGDRGGGVVDGSVEIEHQGLGVDFEPFAKRLGEARWRELGRGEAPPREQERRDSTKSRVVRGDEYVHHTRGLGGQGSEPMGRQGRLRLDDRWELPTPSARVASSAIVGIAP